MFLIDTFLGQNGRRTFHFAAFIFAVRVTFLGRAATRFGILLPVNTFEINKFIYLQMIVTVYLLRAT